MGSSKEEQHRLKTLLCDTVLLLCKNGLTFGKNLKVQGLLGITADDDNVFVVHLDELIEHAMAPTSTLTLAQEEKLNPPPAKSPTKRKRRRSVEKKETPESEPMVTVIKTEPESDVVLLDDPDNYSSQDQLVENVNFTVVPMPTADFGTPPQSEDTEGPTPTKRKASPCVSVPFHSSSPIEGRPYVTNIIKNVNMTDQTLTTEPIVPQAFPASLQNLQTPTIVQPVNHPQSTHQSPSGSTRTPTAVARSRLPDPNPSCKSCQYRWKKKEYDKMVQRLRRAGTPVSKLPKFTEPTMKTNPDCTACRDRCAYFRERMAELRKRKTNCQKNKYYKQ